MHYERFVLGVTLPFRLDFTVWALRRRQKNLIDRWEDSQYSRILIFNDNPIRLNITQEGTGKTAKLAIALQSKKKVTAPVRKEIEWLVQTLLGLSVNLQPFYLLANHNKTLKLLVAQFAGVKPPRFPSVFEALVNAIACQQVTLDLGILLLNRLAETFSPAFVDGLTTCYAFPRAVDLADASEEAIKKLGFSYQKARAIKELATDIAKGELDLTELEQMPTREVLDLLLKIRGIGRWSAEYVLLRGLGRLDVFPGDDVGAQNNLQRLFELKTKPDYEKIRTLTAQWSPYQGLVYFHLLLEKLQRKGVI